MAVCNGEGGMAAVVFSCRALMLLRAHTPTGRRPSQYGEAWGWGSGGMWAGDYGAMVGGWLCCVGIELWGRGVWDRQETGGTMGYCGAEQSLGRH